MKKNGIIKTLTAVALSTATLCAYSNMDGNGKDGQNTVAGGIGVAAPILPGGAILSGAVSTKLGFYDGDIYYDDYNDVSYNNAYNDAMDNYEFDKYQYDQTIHEVNAK